MSRRFWRQHVTGGYDKAPPCLSGLTRAPLAPRASRESEVGSGGNFRGVFTATLGTQRAAF